MHIIETWTSIQKENKGKRQWEQKKKTSLSKLLLFQKVTMKQKAW